MQQELNWPTLQQHRQRNRLVLFYKTMQNMIALQIPSYFNTTHGSTRHHNLRSYIYPSARTNAYMYSYKTIKERNSLPEDTVMANSVSAFYNKL